LELAKTFIDRYLAAWYFWHQDAERGEQALWRLGSQSLFFELRKLEQLHPEAVRPAPFRALPERSPTQQRINSGGAR
jgi:hypothetical protein